MVVTNVVHTSRLDEMSIEARRQAPGADFGAAPTRIGDQPNAVAELSA